MGIANIFVVLFATHLVLHTLLGWGFYAWPWLISSIFIRLEESNLAFLSLMILEKHWFASDHSTCSALSCKGYKEAWYTDPKKKPITPI